MTDFRFLIGSLFFLIIWLFLFIYKKRFRKEMLIMSILTAPLGPISEFFYRDYWKPNYIINLFGFGIEDILFAFLIGGIAAAIYEEFFIRNNKKTKKEKDYFILILTLIGLFSMLFFNLLLKFNSIYVSSISFLAIGFIILIKRKDLIKNALITGIIMAIIMFIFYLIYIFLFPSIIKDWWQIEKISGILIYGVPLEELIWAFSWGFIAGPFYEYWKGEKEKK